MENRETIGIRQSFVLQVILGCCLFGSSCASYEARPLETEERRVAWHARGADDEAVASFVERLAALNEDASETWTFDASDGLTLDEGRWFALVHHPDLRLARLQVERAEASARSAGFWVDPSFSLNLLRVSENVPDRWIVNPALLFTIPLSGRLRSARELAAAEWSVAEYAALEAERDLWRQVRVLWAKWSAALHRCEVLEKFLRSAAELNRVTAELSRLGEIQPTESALFEIETLQRKNQLSHERGELAGAGQELRRLLGLSPEAPVEFLPSLRTTNPELLKIGDGHPTLAKLRAAYAAAEARLQLEVRKQVPDLSLGPQFADEDGESRIGIQGGLPVPVFNANRRAIAEAEVDREICRAAYENAYQELVGRSASAWARAEALASQRNALEAELIPLVDQSVERAFELLKLGEGSALVALESQTRALETQLQWIDVRADEAALRADLEAFSGSPILPKLSISAEDASEDSL